MTELLLALLAAAMIHLLIPHPHVPHRSNRGLHNNGSL